MNRIINYLSSGILSRLTEQTLPALLLLGWTVWIWFQARVLAGRVLPRDRDDKHHWRLVCAVGPENGHHTLLVHGNRL